MTNEKYKDAGVSIDEGNLFIDKILPYAKKTMRPEVLTGIGGFAACFKPNITGMKEPVLVASTDGVGTKLKLAIELGKYDTLGQDLVAMCVNDLICCGAEPIFFLDYFAVGKLEADAHAVIIKGIAEACGSINCALIGGETAEMPGLYAKGDFDLAGFSVGLVDRPKLIDGTKTVAGDIVIGISSSGVHSNGYSLVRKIITDAKLDLSKPIPGDNRTLGDIVLTPTHLYPNLIKMLLDPSTTLGARSILGTYDSIKGIAHITGGGIKENITRVVPETLQVVIDTKTWEFPPIFKYLQEKGNVSIDEMHRVFNCGIGLTIIASPSARDAVTKAAKGAGFTATVIGEIKKRGSDEEDIKII